MKIDKLLFTFAMILLCMVLCIIAINGQASGYEISIYAAYPIYFWFFLIGSFVCGLFILTHNAFSEKTSRWWLGGLAVVILTNGIFLLLPFFRGYAFFGQWDPLTYLGYMKDMDTSSHFGRTQSFGENFYPGMQLIATSLGDIMGVKSKTIAMMFPAIFFSFFIICVYLMSITITGNKKHALLITAFSSLPVYGWLQTEFLFRTLTFFLFPFILYLYYKRRISGSRNAAYSVVFILTLLILPYFHPEFGGIFLIFIFICLEVFLFIYQKIKQRLQAFNRTHELSLIESFHPAMILFIIWFLWFSSFVVFGYQVKGVADWLFHQMGKSEADTYSTWVSNAHMSFFRTIEYILRLHGADIAYFIIPTIFTIVVWRKLLNRSSVNWYYIVFSSLFVIFTIAIPISLLAGYQLAYTRVLICAIFFAALLNGCGLYVLLHRYNRKTAVKVSIVVLTILVVVGIFTTYRSPINKNTNEQVTAMDLQGANWFLNYRNDIMISRQTYFIQYSYFAALRGFRDYPPNIAWGTTEKSLAPPHFGYDYYQTYGESYTEDSYLLVNKLSLVRNPSVFPELKNSWRWTPTEYEKLNQDISVSQIFDDGEFQTYYVKSSTIK